MPDTAEKIADGIMDGLYGPAWEVQLTHPDVPPGRIRDAIAAALLAEREAGRVEGLFKLLRDFDRLTALLAAEKVEATAAWAIVANRDAALATSEAARVKAVEALRQQNHTASEMLRDLGRADLARCFEPAITEGTIP